MVSLIIGGDMVPTENNIGLFSQGNIQELLDEKLLSIIKAGDFRVFNLETPLCENLTPIKKWGPNLSAPLATIKGIKALDPSVLCLANNHIMDQGEEGLKTTLNILKKNQIAYTGVGANIKEAREPYILEKNGIKVGLYCCSEHEFSIAQENISGANPFDALETPDYIEALTKTCNFVVVLYHGGREHYRYPSPALQKRCRKLVEKGASLVICQHSHCIGCFEEYKNSKIIYGQGNFLFDLSDAEEWQTSLLIKIDFNKDGFSCVEIPFVKDNYRIRSATLQEEQKILKNYQNRSEKIKNQKFLFEQYTIEAQKAITEYLSAFKLRNRLAMQNYIECEAHHELFCHAIKYCDFPKSKNKKKFIGKVKEDDGKRKFYFLGMKIFEYKKGK